MDYKEKLEKYFITLGLTFENLDETAWVINDSEKGLENVMVLLEEPVAIIRVNLMNLPKNNREELYETVLKLNAEELVHGAYAIDGDKLILIDTNEIGTFDLEELQASLDSISLAIAQHFALLSKYLD
jgi:hypothetical protein